MLFGMVSVILNFNNTAAATEELHPWGQMALMDLKVIQQTINNKQ